MSYSQGKPREITYFFRSGVVKSDGQVDITEFARFSWSYCCYSDGSLLEDIRSTLAERLNWIYPYYNEVDYKIVVVDDQNDRHVPLNTKSIFDTTAVLDRLGGQEKTEDDPVSIFLVLEQNSLETDLSSITSSSSSSGSIKTPQSRHIIMDDEDLRKRSPLHKLFKTLSARIFHRKKTIVVTSPSCSMTSSKSWEFRHGEKKEEFQPAVLVSMKNYVDNFEEIHLEQETMTTNFMTIDLKEKFS